MKICVMNQLKEEMWVEVPFNVSEVKKQLGKGIEIKNYDLPFDISEDTSLGKINTYGKAIIKMKDKFPYIHQDLRIVVDKWFEDVEDFIRQKSLVLYGTREKMDATLKHLTEKYKEELNETPHFLITSKGVYFYQK